MDHLQRLIEEVNETADTNPTVTVNRADLLRLIEETEQARQQRN